MNRKRAKGWLKHGDFILLDILCLQLSFMLSYWLVRGADHLNPYENDSYQFLAMILLVSQLFVILFSGNYQGILRRKRFDEAVSVGKYILWMLVMALILMFVIHQSSVVSRLQMGFTLLFYAVFDNIFRYLNKIRIFRSIDKEKNKRSIVLITSGDLVRNAMEKLTSEDHFRDYRISGIILLDGNTEEKKQDYGIPLLPNSEEVIRRVSHGWVDEVFLLQPENIPFPTRLMEELMQMGITVNYSAAGLLDDRWPFTDVRKLGQYRVLTTSIRFASAGQMAMKRAMDIAGGLVGCFFTGIVFLFVAPAIYLKSPGPVFFAQDRVGENGKVFKMYKFRSMYLDAEERKAALMAQNKIADGMMFKMDDDPRIIGSEKKDKNGKPKGIGNFIRNTSLDEFPQFYNVLRGEMSLVGWRPATLDEWKRYDLSHRIRASMKPGITGLWQVSGRSEITDFDEVVRLDREYIENWSILLDIKILLKTVAVVLKRQGAE